MIIQKLILIVKFIEMIVINRLYLSAISIKYKEFYMKFLSLAVLILFATVVACKSHNPFEVLIDYQTRQRQSAKLFENDYNLIPFMVHKNKEVFIQQYQADKELNVQVIIYWFNQKNQLVFPEFTLSQKIRITVEEEIFSNMPVEPLMKRQFLTQSGFTLRVQSGKRYKWTIQTNGKQRKMVEIAVGSQHTEQIAIKIQKKNHTNEIALLRSLKKSLERTKQNLIMKQKKEKNNMEMSSMWGWLSGAEILTLLGLLALQLVLFNKFSFSFSVI